jgi:hypothetical protein
VRGSGTSAAAPAELSELAEMTRKAQPAAESLQSHHSVVTMLVCVREHSGAESQWKLLGLELQRKVRTEPEARQEV